MKKNKEKIRKTFRLSDDEAADLKKKAELCGLTETEFIRQLIHGLVPKPLPEGLFWDKMNELYECHSRLKRRADQFKNDPELYQLYSTCPRLLCRQTCSGSHFSTGNAS